MRRTYTSCEVKDRWNREHYDFVKITLPPGTREDLKTVAASRGMSVSEYIRHLLRADTTPEELPGLRGGGGHWVTYKDAAAAAQRSESI